jgi:hypothetical protein
MTHDLQRRHLMIHLSLFQHRLVYFLLLSPHRVSKNRPDIVNI